MRWLELKIPPPVILALILAAMGALSLAAPPLDIPWIVRAAGAGVLTVLGMVLGAAGLWTFARAKTTFDPHHPEESQALVTKGVYRLTRNPMYLGMLVITVAWAVYLGHLLTLPGPVLFVLYITRFQIVPEERILGGLFTEAYAQYRGRTRRWL